MDIDMEIKRVKEYLESQSGKVNYKRICQRLNQRPKDTRYLLRIYFEENMVQARESKKRYYKIK